jgi:hypothetical protein
VTGHHIDLVAFDFAAQLQLGLGRYDAGSQLFGHLLHIILIQTQFLGDLLVRQIQSHQVQAQDPYLQRLVVTRQHRRGQIIEVPLTPRAVILLTRRLRLIETLFANRLRVATGTGNALGPPQFSDRFIAFRVVKQVLKLYHGVIGKHLRCQEVVAL